MLLVEWQMRKLWGVLGKATTHEGSMQPDSFPAQERCHSGGKYGFQAQGTRTQETELPTEVGSSLGPDYALQGNGEPPLTHPPGPSHHTSNLFF